MGGPDGQRPAHNEQRLLMLAGPLWPQEILPCRTTFNQIFLPVNGQLGSYNFREESAWRASGPVHLPLPIFFLFVSRNAHPGLCLPARPNPAPLSGASEMQFPNQREKETLSEQALFLSQVVSIFPSLFLISDRSYQ